MSGSDGCCDCLYDDISVECIVATNCRTNCVLVEMHRSARAKNSQVEGKELNAI